jgi:hypothetical protein
MRRFTRRAGAVFTIVVTVMGFSLAGVVRAEAQGGWSAGDAAALKGHSLTMDKLKRTNDAMIDFAQLEESRDDFADDEGATESIDAMVTRINAVPEARAILKKHGLTTREYVLTLFASTHAATAAYLEENGQKAAGLPVSRGQVEFYKTNKAEIDKLFAERKAASGSHDEDDAEE